MVSNRSAISPMSSPGSSTATPTARSTISCLGSTSTSSSSRPWPENTAYPVTKDLGRKKSIRHSDHEHKSTFEFRGHTLLRKHPPFGAHSSTRVKRSEDLTPALPQAKCVPVVSLFRMVWSGVVIPTRRMDGKADVSVTRLKRGPRPIPALAARTGGGRCRRRDGSGRHDRLPR